MIFGKWLITTNHMTCKSNRTVNPHIKKKAEIRLHYSTTGNFRETARAFNLNESTVREIIKTRPVAGKIILSKKQNFPGAGRPLS